MSDLAVFELSVLPGEEESDITVVVCASFVEFGTRKRTEDVDVLGTIGNLRKEELLLGNGNVNGILASGIVELTELILGKFKLFSAPFSVSDLTFEPVGGSGFGRMAARQIGQLL